MYITKKKNISGKVFKSISKNKSKKTHIINKFVTNKSITNKSITNKSITNKSVTNKQKTLRIIFEHSQSLENDAKVYENVFNKYNYKIDFKIIKNLYHNTIEKYYDVNLFLEQLPSKCKKYFPSKYNLFMPNNELFIDTKEDNKNQSKNRYDRYEELKSINIILCKTQICYKFFNFIKNEKNPNNHKTIYSYQTVYTKFTTNIMKELQYDSGDSSTDSKIDPNLFIHLAGKSSFKNTLDLVYCWIKNNGFLNIDPDIRLVITCYGHCLKWFRPNLKYFYKYDFDKDENVKMDKQNNIATFKNMTIHFKPIESVKEYTDLLKHANVAICISNKEGYGHYINEARYMKKFIITMDYPPMNEMIINCNTDKDNKQTGITKCNGILLKKRNKFSKQKYKETKFDFYEAFPDMNELRDSIIWCIKHKHDLHKYGENGRKMFDDDKQYFEDLIEKNVKLI